MVKFDDIVKISETSSPAATTDGIEEEDFIDDLDMLRYMKEYEAKWPTSFWLQFRVLFLR